MLGHLGNLLGRSLSDFPSLLSANWLSLFLLPAIVFVIREWPAIKSGGWPVVGNHLTRDAALMVAVYTCLFLYVVCKDIYIDHTGLVQKARETSAKLEINRSESSNTLQSTKNSLGERISFLQQQCAKDEGIAQTLQRQSTDQQTLIAGCQENAIKRLVPEPLKLSVFLWDQKTDPDGVEHKETYLVVANKDIARVRMNVSCDVLLTSGTGTILGVSMYSGGAEIQRKTDLAINIDTPTWSAQTPLKVEIGYTSSRSARCFFSEK